MKLEQQVVSLDLAKRMKELGAPQESLFWWRFTVQRESDGHPRDPINKRLKWGEWKDAREDGAWSPKLMTLEEKENGRWIPETKDHYLHNRNLFASAYTVAELGEMLPPSVSSYKRNGKKGRGKFLGEGFTCVCNNAKIIGPSQHSETEADARAAMWCYLKENNLI